MLTNFSDSREPAVAGQFYPKEKSELVTIVKTFLDSAKPDVSVEGEILGIISPHAGYIFSGSVAGFAYKYLSQYKLTNPIIILIGQSHYYYLAKPVVYNKSNFKTPLGEVMLEKEFISMLTSKKEQIFDTDPKAHLPEHSLEVQLPFLQCIYKEFTIVPILVSRYDYVQSQQIAQKIVDVIKSYKNVSSRKIVIVCSTDMSHYPSYENAIEVDNKALKLLQLYDPQRYFSDLIKLEKTKIDNLHCVFCAETAVGITMLITKLLGGDTVKILKYANSGDVKQYGDKSRVVGYCAVAFIRKVNNGGKQVMEKKEPEFKISKENQKILLSLARQAITEYVSSGKVIEYSTEDEELLTPSAVFVTLTKKGQLRGCIGTTFPQYPLYKAVIHSAIAAATEDPRFSPVRLDELKDIKIEISILSPLKRVFSHKEIKEKVHGVVVRRNSRSGLFLPQVWEHFPKKEQFLSELCWSKAGLEPNAWQDSKTELYVFTVFAFEEE